MHEVPVNLPGHVQRRLERLKSLSLSTESWLFSVELAKSHVTSALLGPCPLVKFAKAWQQYPSNLRGHEKGLQKRLSQALKRYRRALRQAGLPEPVETADLRYTHTVPRGWASVTA